MATAPGFAFLNANGRFRMATAPGFAFPYRRMREEWFDVVDENDCVIGRELRADVHRRGLRHRAVHILVWDDSGRVFLQKRSLRKDTAPGAWDSSASGHLDSGETYEACAPRELQEELGWTAPAPLERILKLDACAELGQEFVHVFRTRWDGRAFVLNSEEIDTGAWFAPGEVDARITNEPNAFARSFRYLWAELRRRNLA
jgi:isopentenyl-diphosphate Delta-isomerase